MKLNANHPKQKGLAYTLLYSPTLKINAILCFIFGFSLYHANALASEDSVLRPYGNYSFTHESNVLRLNDSSPDSIQKVEAGLDFKKQISQQLITAKASAGRMWFNRYNAIDNTSTDLAANWNWHVGSHFSGNLGTTYSHALAPFIDFHTPEQNMRMQRNIVADGTWHFHPSWQAHAGYTNYTISSDLSSQNTLDRTDNIAEIGLDYLPSSYSSVGLLARHTNGRMPNPSQFINTTVTPPSLILIDNSYKQDDLMARVGWYSSEKSSLVVSAGYTKRQHEDYPIRNFSGLNVHAIGKWDVTSKAGLKLEAWREIGAYSDTSASYTLNNGVLANPSWDLTSKVRLESRLRYEKRDFLGDHIDTFVSSQPSRTDTSRYGSISLMYKPIQKVQLDLTAYIDQRSSNYSLYHFRSNGIVFNSRYQF